MALVAVTPVDTERAKQKQYGLGSMTGTYVTVTGRVEAGVGGWGTGHGMWGRGLIEKEEDEREDKSAQWRGRDSMRGNQKTKAGG